MTGNTGASVGYSMAGQNVYLQYLEQKNTAWTLSLCRTEVLRENIEVQKRVSETTNTILQKNAEILKQNSIEVAKENENSIVSLETLKMTTQSLIETLSEVKQIHQKGTETRRELDSGLQQLEAELKKSIVS